MKRNNIMKPIAFLFISLLFTCTSCSDFLERDHPTGVTDKDFWKTMNECENALGQCKLWLKGTYGGSELGLIFHEGTTDNMYFQSNFEQRLVSLGNGSLVPPTSNNAPSPWENTFSTWQDCLLRIRRCNRFLEFVDNAYYSDESERTRMKADARIWRAWYHIRLLKWYGRNDGIPILDKALNPTEIYKPRNTVEECLNFINKELDLVINSTDIPFLWDEGRRERMSISSALVLKMDVNLQFKKYDIAKDAAQKLINSGQFELYYTSSTRNEIGKNYRDLFRYVGEQNKERIIFRSGGAGDVWFRVMGTPLGGQGVAAVLKSLVDVYETIDGKTIQSLSETERTNYEQNPLYKPRDPRLAATVIMPGDNTSITNYTYRPFDSNSSDYVGKSGGASRSGYMMRKFIDEQDRATGYGSLDYSLFRYAEVLLTYVECLVEMGDWQDPKVAEYINMIRKRADMPEFDKSVYNTQEKLRELYRRERRVELCFEGKRYDDIRRWGIGPQTMNGPIYGAWNPNTNSYVSIETRNCTFPKYDSWPLPQTEVTSNPNIKQPTGW